MSRVRLVCKRCGDGSIHGCIKDNVEKECESCEKLNKGCVPNDGACPIEFMACRSCLSVNESIISRIFEKEKLPLTW